MRPVKEKTTVGRVTGAAKSKAEVQEKDMAAGTKL
jgi:hypothetical protein